MADEVEDLRAPAIRMAGITKRFGAVVANDAVDLTVRPGSIHGVIGENGAGKSTLMSILYGFYSADQGVIEVEGRPVTISNSADAIRLGIGMVHQHFMLVQSFSVLENVMLGAEGGAMLAQGLDENRRELERLSRDYGLSVDPDALVGDLPVGVQQRVEIIKALRRGAKVLILDEPTGVLTPEETDGLFQILHGLAAEGVSILLITHKLNEIMAVTDQVSVMRGGKMVAHRETAQTSGTELAALMVGREVSLTRSPAEAARGEAALEARGLTWRDGNGVARLDDVSLTLHGGEVLGVAGVSGNGQSELLNLLSGIAPMQDGRLTIGRRVITRADPAGPAEMRRLGLAHVPEDRHHRGLVLPFEARENAVLGYHDGPGTGTGRLINPSALTTHCGKLMEGFDVRPPDPVLRSAGFSGGNQQKLILAREIEAAPKILLIGQPTRGVDIGAIEFINDRIEELKTQGCAILLVSVELEEIFALSDRIAVMNEGRIEGVVSRAHADMATIGQMMAGMGAEGI
ncbi:MAG: ABC transporter ATP-binding protein [Pseudomonadota bacterium]